jgi:hypothetical protein
MSDELDRRRTAETEGDGEKLGDVEAHRFHGRMDEAERMGEAEDKIAATDEDDVEAHMLGRKHTPGKLSE